jgi:hypothetical protein
MIRRLLSIACLAIISGVVCSAQQPQGPRVTVNGHEVIFPDMQPRFLNDHAMVPLRGVFERLHARVDWDAQRQEVTCTSQDATVQLIVGDNEATVDGHKVRFDAHAFMSQGRTYVPLRFLAQTLGAQVDWDDASQTVQITTRVRHHDKDHPHDH